jgi:hypothetical protein
MGVITTVWRKEHFNFFRRSIRHFFFSQNFLIFRKNMRIFVLFEVLARNMAGLEPHLASQCQHQQAVNYKEKNSNNLDNPTGPLHFPIIGSALFMPRKLIHITMAGKWLQKYGPVVGLVFGSRNTIAVCGAREVLEVLQREEFQARPISAFFKERSFGKRLGK